MMVMMMYGRLVLKMHTYVYIHIYKYVYVQCTVRIRGGPYSYSANTRTQAIVYGDRAVGWPREGGGAHALRSESVQQSSTAQ